MPVVTRAMARLMAAAQPGASTSGSPSPPKTSKRSTSKAKKDNLPKEKDNDDTRIPREQQTPQPSSTPVGTQDTGAPKQPQITTPSGIISDPPAKVMVHRPCRKCACNHGAFDYPINSCLNCHHTIDEHGDGWNDPWTSACDFVCERRELIASMLDLIDRERVVVIRAPPLVGKSTLLRLLGHHILHNRPDLEPVYFMWTKQDRARCSSTEEYLTGRYDYWKKGNAEQRRPNPEARIAYLIDEAQGAYGDEEFWSSSLKNKSARSQPVFVLVCLYGAEVDAHLREDGFDSKASKFHPLQRVELRPNHYGQPYLLFKPQDTAESVRKWALSNSFRLEAGVAEYLHSATGGHPGMVGLFLTYFEKSFQHLTLPDDIRRTRTWSKRMCHNAIVDHSGLLNWLTIAGRGVWTPEAEKFVQRNLVSPKNNNKFNFSDVTDALRAVAVLPEGLLRSSLGVDAFTFCLKQGYLDVEPYGFQGAEIKYIFPSPIHQRIAYRRLCPGPKPTESLKERGLQGVCIDAITRLSPSALQRRPTNSAGSWGIPEAAFQAEVYCCLGYELQGLPVLAEYSHTKNGRVDFLITDQRWGIEVLQRGSKAAIMEHANRSTNGRTYQIWNIIEDHVVLNFCMEADLDKINVKGDAFLPHVLHVVLDVEQSSARVYTHRKELKASFQLGEGRKRLISGLFYGPPYQEQEEIEANIARIRQDLEDIQTRERDDELERSRQRMEELSRDLARQEEEMSRSLMSREDQMSREFACREEEMSRELARREGEMSRELACREEEMSRELARREEEMSREVTRWKEEMRQDFARQLEGLGLQGVQENRVPESGETESNRKRLADEASPNEEPPNKKRRV